MINKTFYVNINYRIPQIDNRIFKYIFLNSPQINVKKNIYPIYQNNNS